MRRPNHSSLCHSSLSVLLRNLFIGASTKVLGSQRDAKRCSSIFRFIISYASRSTSLANLSYKSQSLLEAVEPRNISKQPPQDTQAAMLLVVPPFQFKIYRQVLNDFLTEANLVSIESASAKPKDQLKFQTTIDALADNIKSLGNGETEKEDFLKAIDDVHHKIKDAEVFRTPTSPRLKTKGHRRIVKKPQMMRILFLTREC